MQSRESQKKEDTSAPNVREVAKRCVFSMIRVSGESKSRLVKAAGAESCGQRRNQKLHAAVARSTFSSENVQNMSGSDRFLKLRCRKIARRWREAHFQVKMYKTLHSRCRKIARRCGAKHISK